MSIANEFECILTACFPSLFSPIVIALCVKQIYFNNSRCR